MDNNAVLNIDEKKVKKVSAPQTLPVENDEKVVLNFKVEVGGADYQKIVADVSTAIDEILRKRAEERLQVNVDSFVDGLKK